MCEEGHHPGSAKFFWENNVLANKARHYIYYEAKCLCCYGGTLHLSAGEVFLLIWPDTTFIRKGSVFVKRAGH